MTGAPYGIEFRSRDYKSREFSKSTLYDDESGLDKLQNCVNAIKTLAESIKGRVMV